MTSKELKNKYNEIQKKAKRKTYKCMSSGCNQNAIKSHVLQKNGILREISSNSHLFQFENTSVFQIEEKGKFELKKIGVNDVFTFPGFCKYHDSEIFKSIENEKSIDIKSTESIRLFSYRSICQEIRRKEIVLNIAEDMIGGNDWQTITLFSFFKEGLQAGIKNLTFFKEELEKDEKSTVSNFNFEVYEIPKIDVCISGPINIDDDENELSKINNLNGGKVNNPFTTSIINIFPYKNKSYILIAQHNDFPCRWTSLLSKNIKESNEDHILKIISDLISTRFEFWCISPILKEKLEDKISLLLSIWEDNISEFGFEVNVNFNLFE